MVIVIMAGGRGTRIASVKADVPKPMIPICGKPILEHQLLCLKEQGYHKVTLCVGYLGHVIREYFGDGERLGMEISYIEEKEPLGTAGALYFLKGKVHEDILLLNGDIIFDVDIHRFQQFHQAHGQWATLFTHPNSHPYDSGVLETDGEHLVTRWMTKEDTRTWYSNRVNAGLHILAPQVLDMIPELKKTDLDRDLLRPLVHQRRVIAYDSPEYVKDMGTPDRYYAVEEDVRSGLVHARNLLNRQRAVFFDRDGTINRYVGFLRSLDEFELIPDTVEKIRWANNNGYLAIVVTNQPVIARGEVTWDELSLIHKKMETLLGEKGVYVDDIFICPHHPDKGFEGEVAAYKVNCDCRKPKPGLLLHAAAKYNIDLSESFMVGDSDSDRKAAETAGCKAYIDVKDPWPFAETPQTEVFRS